MGAMHPPLTPDDAAAALLLEAVAAPSRADWLAAQGVEPCAVIQRKPPEPEPFVAPPKVKRPETRPPYGTSESFALAWRRSCDLTRARVDGWAVRLPDGTLEKGVHMSWGVAHTHAARVGGVVVMWSQGPRSTEPQGGPQYTMASGV